MNPKPFTIAHVTRIHSPVTTTYCTVRIENGRPVVDSYTANHAVFIVHEDGERERLDVEAKNEKHARKVATRMLEQRIAEKQAEARKANSLHPGVDPLTA